MRVRAVGAFVVLFSRDLKNLALNPALVLYNTAFPLLLILVFAYLTSGNYGGMGVTSYDFYGVTMLLYIVLNVSSTAANSFMERTIRASNLRALYAPVPLFCVYTSKIAATFTFTSLCFTGIVAVLHFVLGVRLGGAMFGRVLAILLLFNLLSSALGVMFCCIFRSEEVTNKVVSLVANVMALLGGLLFPVDGLSRNIERISWLSPVKWVAESIFQLIYDQDTSMFWSVVLVLSGLIVGALIVCKLTFRVEDYV